MSTKKHRDKFAKELAALQDQHSKSAGKGGKLLLIEIDEIYRQQAQANQESGEK